MSLIAGKGAALSMVGAVVLADAVAENTGEPEEVFGPYEARLRPWAEAARRVAIRNVRLFTPANRHQLVAHAAVLRLAARPSFALVVKRLLNRKDERL